MTPVCPGKLRFLVNWPWSPGVPLFNEGRKSGIWNQGTMTQKPIDSQGYISYREEWLILTLNPSSKADMKSIHRKMFSAIIGMAALFIMASPLSAADHDPPPAPEDPVKIIIEVGVRS